MGTEGKNPYLLKLSFICTPNPRFPRVRTTRCRPRNKNKTLRPFSECKMVKVKWTRYRPGVAQRVDRGIALLFHDRGTRRGWVVSSARPPAPGKDPVPIVQEAGWTSQSLWMGGKSRSHQDSIPDRPARSQSLYRLSYRAHLQWI